MTETEARVLAFLEENPWVLEEDPTAWKGEA